MSGKRHRSSDKLCLAYTVALPRTAHTESGEVVDLPERLRRMGHALLPWMNVDSDPRRQSVLTSRLPGERKQLPAIEGPCARLVAGLGSRWADGSVGSAYVRVTSPQSHRLPLQGGAASGR